jgi:hypothetical protein
MVGYSLGFLAAGFFAAGFLAAGFFAAGLAFAAGFFAAGLAFAAGFFARFLRRGFGRRCRFLGGGLRCRFRRCGLLDGRRFLGLLRRRFLLGLRGRFRRGLRRFAAAGQDIGDAQHGEVLAMTAQTAVMFPPLFLEHEDLVATLLRNDLGGDGRAVDQRGAHGLLGLIADHQHFAQLDRAAGLGVELLDLDNIVFGDPVLLAAGSDHCEHGSITHCKCASDPFRADVRSTS